LVTGVAPAGRFFAKKWKFLIFLGPHSQPSAPIDVKVCAAKRTQVPVGPAKFDLNRCNESPLRGEKTHFWPVSKNNTGSLPLRGNPAGKQHIFAPTAGARCTIFSKLCVVIELVVPILKGVIHFWI